MNKYMVEDQIVEGLLKIQELEEEIKILKRINEDKNKVIMEMCKIKKGGIKDE